MKVGEVAERAGVNVETLRYYERRGLLPEPERLPSGHRRYDEETVRFLRAIKEAQSVGFTLAEIGEYLRAARRSGSPSETLRIRMAAKIDEIDSRIAGLRRMRDELARVVGCACESLDHCTCGAAYLARRGRDADTRPSLLHVTNGESAGNPLRRTALAHGAEARPELIALDSFPGRPAFRGLGELTADELETLWPDRTQVTQEATTQAAAFWDAFRAPEPTALAEWAGRESEELPFLG